MADKEQRRCLITGDLCGVHPCGCDACREHHRFEVEAWNELLSDDAEPEEGQLSLDISGPDN